MVFQIRDDILDIIATDGQLQKPAGQDLAEGIYTLPALDRAGRPRRRARTCAPCSGSRWPSPNATRRAPS